MKLILVAILACFGANAEVSFPYPPAGVPDKPVLALEVPISAPVSTVDVSEKEVKPLEFSYNYVVPSVEVPAVPQPEPVPVNFPYPPPAAPSGVVTASVNAAPAPLVLPVPSAPYPGPVLVGTSHNNEEENSHSGEIHEYHYSFSIPASQPIVVPPVPAVAVHPYPAPVVSTDVSAAPVVPVQGVVSAPYPAPVVPSDVGAAPVVQVQGLVSAPYPAPEHHQIAAPFQYSYPLPIAAHHAPLAPSAFIATSLHQEPIAVAPATVEFPAPVVPVPNFAPAPYPPQSPVVVSTTSQHYGEIPASYSFPNNPFLSGFFHSVVPVEQHQGYVASPFPHNPFLGGVVPSIATVHSGFESTYYPSAPISVPLVPTPTPAVVAAPIHHPLVYSPAIPGDWVPEQHNKHPEEHEDDGQYHPSDNENDTMEIVPAAEVPVVPQQPIEVSYEYQFPEVPNVVVHELPKPVVPHNQYGLPAL